MRVSGVTIPDGKRLEVGLTTLYGVGLSRARKILNGAKIDFDTKGKDLSADDENKIRKLLEEYILEGSLRREVSTNIKRLKDTEAYRGLRHSKNLPARGQRTKSNSRTSRGNVRKTMGSGKRKVEKK